MVTLGLWASDTSTHVSIKSGVSQAYVHVLHTPRTLPLMHTDRIVLPDMVTFVSDHSSLLIPDWLDASPRSLELFSDTSCAEGTADSAGAAQVDPVPRRVDRRPVPD